LAEEERRRARAKAERPTPSNTSDDGSGAPVTGVSENWFVTETRTEPPLLETLSITLKLVAAEEKLLLSLSLVFELVTEADRDVPFDSISVSPKWGEVPEPSCPVIASDASVIGSLDGAVMVYEMLPLSGFCV